MKRNIIAVIAYPVVLFLYIGLLSINTEILGITSVPAIISNFLILFPFVLSPIVSGLIVNKNPVRYALLGSLLFLALIICFAPFVVKLLITPIGPTSQKLMTAFPQVDFNLATKAFRLLTLLSSPIVIAFAVIGGIIGGRTKKIF